MYLVDTDVVSELRKKDRADPRVAATALLYDLILVTRNVKHFAATGVKLLDPFAG